jgi:hypothetical protein
MKVPVVLEFRGAPYQGFPAAFEIFCGEFAPAPTLARKCGQGCPILSWHTDPLLSDVDIALHGRSVMFVNVMVPGTSGLR